MNDLSRLDAVELFILGVLFLLSIAFRVVEDLRPAATQPEPVTVSAVVLLHRAGYSQRAIAAELGITRHRVRQELASA